MNDEQFEELLSRYNNGNCTDQEKDKLENWVTFGVFGYTGLSEKQIDQHLTSLSRRLPLAPTVRKLRLWPSIAAAIVFVILSSLYFFLGKQPDLMVYSNDVAPGKVGATLTLSNGKSINLALALNGQLAKDIGIKISKSAQGQLIYQVVGAGIQENSNLKLNTLTTGAGETFQVRLPDGSSVWLNAASSLTFPVSFNGQESRSVRLSGEAYFEIAKDRIHPFYVMTTRQEVKVLGTHFNINSYVDEKDTKTTLLEGSLRVTPVAVPSVGPAGIDRIGIFNNVGAVLKPGQQSIVDSNAHIGIRSVDIEEAQSWKNGYFVFSSEDIRSIMRKVARWYNVEVVYQDNIGGKAIWGSVSRSKNISSVLRMLTATGAVSFKLEGKKVTVLRGVDKEGD